MNVRTAASIAMLLPMVALSGAPNSQISGVRSCRQSPAITLSGETVF
jgi:hypothetical protein